MASYLIWIVLAHNPGNLLIIECPFNVSFCVYPAKINDYGSKKSN